MKINLFGRILFLTLVSGTVLCAGDPWEDKPPSKWSSEDINKLLAKSPWVKGVTAPSPFATEIVEIQPGYMSPIPDRVVTINPRTGERQVRYVQRRIPPKYGRSPVILEYTFVWLSARAIQYALAAQERSGPAILDWWWGPRKELMVSESARSQVILLAGPYTQSLRNLSGQELKESVYLEYGKGDLKIPVEYVQSFPGRESVLLYFPRTHGAEFEKVRIHCKIVGIVVKKSFDLRKMTFEGSPII